MQPITTGLRTDLKQNWRTLFARSALQSCDPSIHQAAGEMSRGMQQSHLSRFSYYRLAESALDALDVQLLHHGHGHGPALLEDTILYGNTSRYWIAKTDVFQYIA